VHYLLTVIQVIQDPDDAASTLFGCVVAAVIIALWFVIGIVLFVAAVFTFQLVFGSIGNTPRVVLDAFWLIFPVTLVVGALVTMIGAYRRCHGR